MGRVVIPASDPAAKKFDLKLDWSEGCGILFIEGGEPTAKEQVLVNDVEYEIEFDANGCAQLQFEKSNLPSLYEVRMKLVPEGTKDHRAAFWY